MIPVYNVGKYLPDFLHSVAAHGGGLGDVEIVFVNDGSVDQSEELIRDALPVLGERVQLISTENHGPSHERNTRSRARDRAVGELSRPR
ncbi:MAG: glycosyltransferase family A protein [Microbacterium sp.]